MSTRVYVPSTVTRLRELLVSGGLGPVPFLAHAVTEPLRDSGEAEEEDWEYAALTAAAQDALGLLTDEDPPRRVVVVAEAETTTPVAGAEPSLVEVGEVIPLRKVVSLHVDSAEAEDTVAAARGPWQSAAAGEPGDEDLVEACLDHELAWFATQEIGDVVGDQP